MCGMCWAGGKLVRGLPVPPAPLSPSPCTGRAGGGDGTRTIRHPAAYIQSLDTVSVMRRAKCGCGYRELSRRWCVAFQILSECCKSWKHSQLCAQQEHGPAFPMHPTLYLYISVLTCIGRVIANSHMWILFYCPLPALIEWGNTDPEIPSVLSHQQLSRCLPYEVCARAGIPHPFPAALLHQRLAAQGLSHQHVWALRRSEEVCSLCRRITWADVSDILVKISLRIISFQIHFLSQASCLTLVKLLNLQK